MPRLARSLRALLRGILAVAVALPLWAQGQVDTSRRTALVIGNNAYEAGPLANAVNDAQAMAGALREAGFNVTLLTDVDQRQFQLALREFGERLKFANGTGLFYYAGHGVQIRGRNFLIPVRANIAHEDEVAYAAVDAQAVLDKMDSAGNGTNIVILDACRDNPFVRSTRSSQQGLAQMDAPVGTLVAYATAPGSVAVDSGRGMRNGLYTTHLLDAVRRRGLKVEDVFKQTRNAVLRASGNKQMPWEASALVGDFYFHPPAEGAAPASALLPPVPTTSPAAAPAQSSTTAAADPQGAIDDALWEAVKDSRNSAELFAYLNRFPFGRHARDARRRLLDLAQPGGAGPSAGAAGAAGTAGTSPAPNSAGPADNLPLPPPRTAIGAPNSGELVPRSAVEEAVRWGTMGGGDRRPSQPRRNSAGFAEGDRFRYQKTDYFGAGGGVTDYLWHIDRIENDGSLWLNGGRQRLDARGQRTGGNDEHTGVWIDLAPPLPLAELAQRSAGASLPFTTSASIRDAAGLVEQLSLGGTLRTSADSVRGPRGFTDLLPAMKIEVHLVGNSARSDGVVRSVTWRHTYWMAPPLLLPVAFEIVEVADGLTRQNTRHDLIAIDQMSLAEAAAAGAAAPAVQPGAAGTMAPVTTPGPAAGGTR